MKILLLELGVDVGRVALRCDSKCAIALINGDDNTHAKHIDVRYNYTREQQAMGNILVTHIKVTEQPADLFTKALPRTTFEKYRQQIGVKHID